MHPARLRPTAWAQSPSRLVPDGDPHLGALTAGLFHDKAGWNKCSIPKLPHDIGSFQGTNVGSFPPSPKLRQSHDYPPINDQVIRQNCRTLKTPAIAAQYQGLAEAAAREGHSHVRHLDVLLGAEIDERERKVVLRRVKEARLSRLKTLQEFDFAQSPVSVARRELALEAAINRLDRFHLLILVDLAYVSKDQAETSVLFELISARYERRSTLITANQPFGAWGQVLPKPKVS